MGARCRYCPFWSAFPDPESEARRVAEFRIFWHSERYMVHAILLCNKPCKTEGNTSKSNVLIFLQLNIETLALSEINITNTFISFQSDSSTK